MEPIKILLNFPAKSIESVLEVLQEIRQSTKHGEKLQVPITNLYLKSGQVVTGWLLDLQREKAIYNLLFLLKDKHVQVMYVELENIAAITIQEPQLYAEFLSENTEVNYTIEKINRLEARYQSADLSQKLSQILGKEILYEVDWTNVACDDTSRGWLIELMNEVTHILLDLALDDFEKSILQSTLTCVHFSEGEPLVKRVKDTLNVQADFSQGREGKLTRKALQSAIEETL
jgi:hypothetical protein